MSLLVVQDVTQTRGQGRRTITVLRGASFGIEEGECVSLQGPSGSGKTTLLATAAGILTPIGGSVLVNGRSLTGMSFAERCGLRATTVGFIFQRANLLSGLSAIQNIVLAARLAGIPQRRARDLAIAVLEQLDAASLAERYPRQLSGGEEQRVAIARALVHSPPLVLADEPTGSLDPATGDRVIRALLDLAAIHRSAVLIATHDPRLRGFVSRSLSLRAGRVFDEA